MASVAISQKGTARVQFTNAEGTRKTIYLGKSARKGADVVCRHVEHLLAQTMTGQPLPRETAAWLSQLGEALKRKLARVGLIAAPKAIRLGEFLRCYILERTDVKPATIEVHRQTCRNLTKFFGDEKSLRNITPGNAEQFRAWLLEQNLASTTVAKRLSFARTFFHIARKHKFIDENPFVELKIPHADVRARQLFVSLDVLAPVIDAADITWRTIIALARLGGLRCPSEVLSLCWSDIDWERQRITVRSPKTDRYLGKATREIPLFRELRPYLEAARQAAKEGQSHVIGKDYLARANSPTGWKNCNLRSAFRRLLNRVGVEDWPKLFHNLRSSRETELLDQHPPHVVARWMGHGVDISMKHYAQITSEHFDRATGSTASALCANNDANSAQNPTQQVAAGNCTDRKTTAANSVLNGVYATQCDSTQVAANSKSGEGGIRTLGTVARTPVFETGD